MLNLRQRHGFRFWIVFTIILTVCLCLIPVLVVIYGYGDSITRANLFDQLDVSVNDIMIRFEDSLDDYSVLLEDFASSREAENLVQDLSEENIQSLTAFLGSIERDAWLTLIDPEGRLLWSEVAGLPPDADYSWRIPAGEPEGISYSTAFRYTTPGGDRVVINLAKAVKDEGGSIIAWALLDVSGSQYIRYADPALVNEVCLYDESTGMVSSLIHLEDYRPLDDGWFFSQTFMRESGNLLISSRPLDAYGFTLVGYLDISPYMQSLYSVYTVTALILAVCAVFALAFAFLLSSKLVHPVHSLIRTMGEVEEGNLDARVSQSQIREMDELYEKFNEMLSQLKLLMKHNEEEKDKVRDAERKALEAQMNPHFLFNTLNVMRSIARLHGEKQIEDLTLKLGRLLRYAVDNKESTETIGNSMLMVESYLGIQSVRFGDKLEVRIDVDERVRNAVTPKLIIQPLVENAISHGLEPKVGNWLLEISISLNEPLDRVIVKVRDNGTGFDASAYADMEAYDHSVHTGMYNVYKRLKLYYGKNASFSIQSEFGKGSEVTLSFPPGDLQ